MTLSYGLLRIFFFYLFVKLYLYAFFAFNFTLFNFLRTCRSTYISAMSKFRFICKVSFYMHYFQLKCLKFLRTMVLRISAWYFYLHLQFLHTHIQPTKLEIIFSFYFRCFRQLAYELLWQGWLLYCHVDQPDSGNCNTTERTWMTEGQQFHGEKMSRFTRLI